MTCVSCVFPCVSVSKVWIGNSCWIRPDMDSNQRWCWVTWISTFHPRSTRGLGPPFRDSVLIGPEGSQRHNEMSPDSIWTFGFLAGQEIRDTYYKTHFIEGTTSASWGFFRFWSPDVRPTSRWGKGKLISQTIVSMDIHGAVRSAASVSMTNHKNGDTPCWAGVWRVLAMGKVRLLQIWTTVIIF